MAAKSISQGLPQTVRSGTLRRCRVGFLSGVGRPRWHGWISDMAAFSRFQKHSHPDYLADDVDFLGILKHQRRALRCRVGLDQQPVVRQNAPAANTTTTMLEKINRAVEFI